MWVGGGVLTNFHPERDCRWKRNSSGSPFLPTWKEKASEMKMSYYGAWVTTNREAYKGKATVHCNLFAGPRTVTSNTRQRNGIAHGWRRKRRWQLWLIETSQRLHTRQLRAVSPTQKSHAVILPWHFRYRVQLTWVANYHATAEAVPPGFTLYSLPPWQSQGRICSHFTSFVKNFYDINLGEIFSPKPLVSFHSLPQVAQ